MAPWDAGCDPQPFTTGRLTPQSYQNLIWSVSNYTRESESEREVLPSVANTIATISFLGLGKRKQKRQHRQHTFKRTKMLKHLHVKTSDSTEAPLAVQCFCDLKHLICSAARWQCVAKTLCFQFPAIHVLKSSCYPGGVLVYVFSKVFFKLSSNRNATG